MTHPSNQNDDAIQATLGKPGDGIPLPARWVLKHFVKPFVVRKTDWERCSLHFEKNHQRIKQEILATPVPLWTQRVLVDPIRGLEDSSRYWSIAMTARHLVRVGEGVEAILTGLAQGIESLPKADTAAVKPESQYNHAESVTRYFEFGDSLVPRIQKKLEAPSMNLQSQRTHPHPWFGEMKVKDWYWLLGTHGQIHLTQIRAIRKGLPSVP